MRNKRLVSWALTVVTAGFLLASASYARAANPDTRQTEALKEEIRHQLVTLPYYSVFDWLQADIHPDGTVILAGEVTRPSIKDDAEARVKKLEGASQVVSKIEVLPLSPMDDQLRVALYRSIFGFSLLSSGMQRSPFPQFTSS